MEHHHARIVAVLHVLAEDLIGGKRGKRLDLCSDLGDKIVERARDDHVEVDVEDPVRAGVGRVYLALKDVHFGPPGLPRVLQRLDSDVHV